MLWAPLSPELSLGLAPCIQIVKGNLQEELKQGGRSVLKSSSHWLRQTLIVSEIAFSLGPAGWGPVCYFFRKLRAPAERR